ncbi:MAG: hypothetical protein ACTSW1_15710 [Candidatus Hodarchaeales archaeon]
MVVLQSVTAYDFISPEIVLIVGGILTFSIFAIALYLGYKKGAHRHLYSTPVLVQIAVFSVLGIILSYFEIPFILDTHISFAHITDWTLAMAYGPYVGIISGIIVNGKGMLTGNWTGPVSGAVFCAIIGTLSMYINPEKRGRPLYMIIMMVIFTTWSFGLMHMWYAYSGLVAPFLVILNLLISLPNNILYGIIIEIIIHVEQIWDPLTENSTLEWYQDDYIEPSESIQARNTSLQVVVLNSLFYAWFATIFMTPPFTFSGSEITLFYQPLLFALMILFSLVLLLASHFIYKTEQNNLVSPLVFIGGILTLPIGFLSLYVWFKYLRHGIKE